MRPRLGFQKGFSLIELMIAMAIGLFLVAVVGVLFVNSKVTYFGPGREFARSGEFSICGRVVRAPGSHCRLSRDPIRPVASDGRPLRAGVFVRFRWNCDRRYGWSFKCARRNHA